MRSFTFCALLLLLSGIHALDTNKDDEIDIASKGLTYQCTQFVHHCVNLCGKDEIEKISSNCSSREASCSCNGNDVSSMVFDTMLKSAQEEGGEEEEEEEKEEQVKSSRKQLQVETDNDMLSAVQFKDVSDEEEQDNTYFDGQEDDAYFDEQGNDAYFDYSEEDEQDEYQDMEYIYPRPEMVENSAFQRDFCSKFLIRCKQDCPAAFSSYYCDANQKQTGFLLSCFCNGVDLAASVNAQVQAESK